MEHYDHQSVANIPSALGGAMELRLDCGFVAENPEAFGLISDAHPLSVGNLLIASGGRLSHGGGILDLSRFDGEAEESPLLNLPIRSEALHTVLDATFGSRPTHREQPVSRYTAVITEAVALGVLEGAAKGASPEQTCVLLGSELRHTLGLWRDALAKADLDATDETAFSASFGACRIHSYGGGEYGIDLFAGGDFRVFLLDENGMAPLWMDDTPLISPDGEEDPIGHTLRLNHPEPFAILLLSGSVCDPPLPEQRSGRMSPALVWRHRMSLEERFLRLLTACLREGEFRDRATHLFTGRLRGRDSGSGAMLVVDGGGSFEVFRTACQKRWTVLEKLLSLFPEDYDPESPEAPPSRYDAEMAYLRRLLDRNAGLEERVSMALRQCVLEKLETLSENSPAAPLPDAPCYRRLEADELGRVFRRYDVDNDEDRARIADNRRALQEGLSDYWITLRPRFLTVSKDVAHPVRREENRRSFEACLELNRELSALLRKRRETMARLHTLLSDGLEVLKNEENDWICGRAGHEGLWAWAEPLRTDLPVTLGAMKEDWQTDTERYRSLHTAYTAERDQLFRRDITEPYGFFARDWEAIREGSMTDERWEELKESVTRASKYGALLDALRRISDATGLLNVRIRERAAESRAARELSDLRDLRLSCLRASAYEDTDWGDEVVAVMSPAMRNEYRLMLRRHKESEELHHHRVTMFEEYSRMYTAYRL